MANKKRLIEELREIADLTPPICEYDKPHNVEAFGKEITVYCKPFEQFRELLRRAADALSVDAVEVAEYEAIVYKLECLLCHATGGKYSKAGYSLESMERMVTDYIEECCEEAVSEELVWCKNCRYYDNGRCRFWNAEIHPENFCSFGERKDNGTEKG